MNKTEPEEKNFVFQLCFSIIKSCAVKPLVLLGYVVYTIFVDLV